MGSDENLDKSSNYLEEDFMVCYGNVSNNSEDTWRSGLELYNDEQTIFSSGSSGNVYSQYQVYAITDDSSEEFNANNDPIVNPENVRTGANHMAEGDTKEIVAARVKVQLTIAEWDTIKATITTGAAIPVNARREVLLGYHYALHRQSQQLEKEKSEIRKRRESVSAASKAFHAEHSNASYTNSGRHHRHGSRVDNLKHTDIRNLSRNLDSSFLSVNEQGNIIPKTPEAALVAAQAYPFTTQPTTGDPREHMHRATLQGLGLVGDKLKARDEVPRRHEGTRKSRSPNKERSPCRHNSPRHRSRGRRSRSPSPRHYNSPRHEGSRRSKSPRYTHDNEDDEKEMGASCFTRRVHRTPVPKGLKLPHDQQKYDRSQEP
jgi:hypothetical protein